MLRRLGSRVAAWLMYRVFIFVSKRVPFATFTQIWNMAYQAHCEAEWTRLLKLSLSTNPPQDALEDYRALMLSERQLEQISLKPELNAGQDAKPESKVIH